MSDPKLLRIVKDIASRVAIIKKDSGFYSDVGQHIERGRFIFNQEQIPATAIFLDGGNAGGEVGSANKTDIDISIRASQTYSENPEDVALKMLSDVHKAIEINQPFTPGKTDIIRNIQEKGWQIVYPEDSSSIISIEVNYSFSYSRKYGED